VAQIYYFCLIKHLEMKEFTKMTLAVICGIIVVTVVGIMFLSAIAGASLASSNSHAALPAEGVLKIDLSEITVGEQSVEPLPFSTMSIRGVSLESETIGIWDAVSAINIAAEDPAVKYIYLKTDGNSTGLANLQEVRHSLANFRATSGKPVVAYIESPTTASYYLASVADQIYMTSNPGATTMVNGISVQMTFLGDLLKALGVNIQLIRHGKYKSAGEMYTRGNSSPENHEQYQEMVDSMWESVAGEIAESRGMSVADLNAALDELKLCISSDFLDEKFVDALFTRAELENKLADLAVKSKFKDVKMISFSDYIAAKVVSSKAKDKIAVIYANGEILDGAGKEEVTGDRFAGIIAKVRCDSTVKAVVLRVNSPGGSVLASDKIKAELDLLKESKPLVASYGSYAASGGYWISANCDKIYSDATTLTGSIGVFGIVPDFSKSLDKFVHVGVENVSSNKHSDMYSLMRPFDDAEYAYMQRSIEDIYVRFTALAADGRGLDVDYVDSIGQGRVWTGTDALRLHLVDELGGLEEAIRYAAVAAGDPDLGHYNVKAYPKAPSQIETIMELLQPSNSDDVKILQKFEKYAKDLKSARIVARLPYEIETR